jgi:hypothetical protein
MIWVLREAISGEPLINQIKEPNDSEFPVMIESTEYYWHMERQHY